MAITGCPLSVRFSWKTGERYFDTEDSNPSNSFSNDLHLSGNFGSNILIRFCMKTSASTCGTYWPSGCYCIYKKYDCPHGFQTGSIYSDDEDNNNNNRHSGTLPDGDYGRNTRIYFCCRCDGSYSQPIDLPLDKPFFLMRHHRAPACQSVLGCHKTEEKVRWDDEDSQNSNSFSGERPAGETGHDHAIHYCYYEPGKEYIHYSYEYLYKFEV